MSSPFVAPINRIFLVQVRPNPVNKYSPDRPLYRLHFVPLSVPAPRRYSCAVLLYLSLLYLSIPCLRQGAAAAVGKSIPARRNLLRTATRPLELPPLPLQAQGSRLPDRHSPTRAAPSVRGRDTLPTRIIPAHLLAFKVSHWRALPDLDHL